MGKNSDITLSVEVEYDRGEEKLSVPGAFVAAFDDKGGRIVSAPIKKGCADLKLPAEFAGQTIRIFHAPTEFKLKDTASIPRLQRYLALEKRYFVNPEANDLRVTFPKLNLTYWLSACCRVRGKVQMRIRMPNGKTRYAPLCNARLQIYEVDHTFPMLIKALPDHLVYRLRDEWKAAIQNPVMQAETRPEVAAIGEGLRQALTTDNDTLKVKPQVELRKLLETVFKLKTATPLRKAIIDNFTLLRPYLCFFDWFPFHDLDLLKTVDIAADGTFDTHIYYPCFGDKPDLYFKVLQDCHEGGWLTVYEPSVHCSTYWNYCCGTEVNIQVSHPKAAPGLSIPGCNFPYDSSDPAVMGKSEAIKDNSDDIIETPFKVGHAALLHTGKVILLPAENVKKWTLWDPANPQATPLELPPPDDFDQLYCCSHTFLRDGKLLIIGGGGHSSSLAIRSTWTFDPHGNVWDKKEDMEYKRWYPTAITLSDGRVLAISGTGVTKVEVYDPDSGWDEFTGADHMLDGTNIFSGLYPGLHLIPSGDVFYTRTGFNAQPGDKSATLEIGHPGNHWHINYKMKYEDHHEGMSVMLLRRHEFSEPGPGDADPQPLDSPIPYARILVIGGGGSRWGAPGNRPTCQDKPGRSVEMIDLPPLSGTPAWKDAADLHDKRCNGNAILLPDGTVLVCGGAIGTTIGCEIYDPDNDSWIKADPLKYERMYHSVALLLPDGKVLITSGDTGNKRKMELYSPPYLFRGPRPSYTIPDHHIHHDAEFSIHSPDACRIKKIGFMRPSAVTHQTDTEQRYIPLHFDRHGKCELRIRAPKSGAIAPPGYYMLFIVDDCGIPSEARFVQLH